LQKFKVVLLGVSGALGSAVSKQLEGSENVLLYKVSRTQVYSGEGTIYWDFKSIPPKEITSADVVINCARSPDYRANILFNRLLCEYLSLDTKFINVSSNCVFASPRGYLSRLTFKGDAYIREKLLIESLSKQRGNTCIIRPTIVHDEGGWRSFLSHCEKVRSVYGPANSNRSHVKVINRDAVASYIAECALAEQQNTVEEELYENVISVSDFIGKAVVESDSDNNYFESNIKNLLLTLLCSRFLPDSVVFKLQSYIVSGSENAGSEAPSSEDYFISGMTRLYLFGRHTL
jgi:dTDP-4-dehydrorhamnose reductase